MLIVKQHQMLDTVLQGCDKRIVIAEFQVVALRDDSYESKRSGAHIERKLLVLLEVGCESPVQHTVDYRLKESEKAGKFALGSKVRIAIEEITTGNFGKRILLLGFITK